MCVLNRSLRYALLFLGMAEVARWYCQAQVQESGPGDLTYGVSNSESNLEQLYDHDGDPVFTDTADFEGNGQNADDVELEESALPADKEAGGAQYDAMVQKRRAQSRRENGNRRRLMKHGQLVPGRRSKQRHNMDRVDTEHSNLTGKQGHKKRPIYTHYNENVRKNHKSRYNSNKHGHGGYDDSLTSGRVKKLKKTNKITVTANSPEGNVDLSGKNDKDTVLNSDKPEADSNIVAPGIALTEYSGEKHKHAQIKDTNLHRTAEYYNDFESGDNVIAVGKKHKKQKQRLEKPEEDKGDDQVTENFNEEHKKHNVNKMVAIKPIGEENDESADNYVYANMSLINQGFLGAIEKKLIDSSGGSGSVADKHMFSANKDLMVVDSKSNKHGNSEADKLNAADNTKTEEKHESSETLAHNHFQKADTEKKHNTKGRANKAIRKPKVANLYVLPGRFRENAGAFKITSQHSEKQVDSNDIPNSLVAGSHRDNTEQKHKRGAFEIGSTSNFEYDEINSGEQSLQGNDNTETRGKVNIDKNSQGDSNARETKKRNGRGVKINDRTHNDYRYNKRNGGNVFRPFFTSKLNDQPYEDTLQMDSMFKNGRTDHRYQKNHQLYEKLPNHSSHDDAYSGEVDSKKIFSRKTQGSRKGTAYTSTESCVELIVSQTDSTTASTESVTTTTEKTETTCETKSDTKSTKTTARTSIKTQSTPSTTTEDDEGSTTAEVFSNYDLFLSGQLADNFVKEVLRKVRRSKKIMKELGFYNDTEESCDRCIETKSGKWLDLGTMRSSLGTNSQACSSLPKPLEDFVFVLTSFDKGENSSAYSYIRDDSSFIFTGDYPEQSVARNEDSTGARESYGGDKGTFEKDSFDKQRLREESNEEKGGGQAAEDDRKHDDVKEREDDVEAEASEKPNTKNTKGKEIKEDSYDRGSLHSDPKFESNDLVEVFDTKDLIPPVKDSEPDDLSNSVKRRRKAFRSEKPQSRNENIAGINENIAIAKSPYGDKNNDFFSVYPQKNKKQSNDFRSKQGYRNEEFNFNTYGDVNSYRGGDRKQDNALYVKEGRSHVQNQYQNPYLSMGNTLNSYGERNNHFVYSPKESYGQKTKYPQYPMDDGFANRNWDSKIWDDTEYQLFPNQQSVSGVKGSQRKSGQFGRVGAVEEYDSNLRMAKRDAEPYDDELIFLEVPNIEYDLY